MGDRPRDPAKWDEIEDVVAALSIPVIANGDVLEYDDFSRIKTAIGTVSVMVSRGAMWNASIYSPKGKSHWDDVKIKYLRKSILWNNDVKSTKYTIKERIAHHSCLELREGKSINKADTLENLAEVTIFLTNNTNGEFTGWKIVDCVLGCLGELNKEGMLPIPPVGVISLLWRT